MVFAERQEIISGGNFHGEYPAKVSIIIPCIQCRHIALLSPDVKITLETGPAVTSCGLSVIQYLTDGATVVNEDWRYGIKFFSIVPEN